MTKLVPVPPHEEESFCELLAELNLDRSQFKLELTEYSPATYGSRVKTIELFWKDRVIAEYGAATAINWVEQFRADWDSGLIPEILVERAAST